MLRANNGVTPIPEAATATDTEPGQALTDAEIIARSVRDGEAFALLFDRHSVAVHRYLARRIGTGPADDLLAQTFLIAFERRAAYQTERVGARPWLYGIATNLLHRHHREEVRLYRAVARAAADPAATDGVADRVAARVDAGAVSRHLAAALAELKQPDRDVLLLFSWADLGYDEIARALDIPVGTVRSRLHRARTIVRAALGLSAPNLEAN